MGRQGISGEFELQTLKRETLGLMARFRLRAFLREKVLGHTNVEIFSRIYQKNSWANRVSVSGDGSDLIQTQIIRRELPLLIESLGVDTMLDAPCGDYFWMRQLPVTLDRYIGADIVPDLIAKNQNAYGSERVGFAALDITHDPLPKVDLILCRDCLVHLPLGRALAALKNFKNSGSKYLLTTTYPGLLSKNKDLVITGNWRPLNLELPPFSLPKPVRVINEGCTEVDDFTEKSLGLWELAQVPL